MSYPSSPLPPSVKKLTQLRTNQGRAGITCKDPLPTENRQNIEKLNQLVADVFEAIRTKTWEDCLCQSREGHLVSDGRSLVGQGRKWCGGILP
jgi:hypothetical protein